jgi:transposase
MRRWGRAGLSEEKIEQVLRSARTTLGVPCLRHEEQWLRVLGQELERTREALHQAARASIPQQGQAWVEADACARRLATVVGRVTAAVLMAKQGSPLSYPSAASYLKGLRLNLKEKSSGKHRGQLKLTKRGPALSRKYLYWAALRLLAQDPRAQAWYRRKRERNGHAGPRGVVALMRKLAKALWHVAQGQAFDSSKLFNPAELQSAA